MISAFGIEHGVSKSQTEPQPVDGVHGPVFNQATAAGWRKQGLKVTERTNKAGKTSYARVGTYANKQERHGLLRRKQWRTDLNHVRYEKAEPVAKTAFGIEHGGISKSELGGMRQAFKIGRVTRGARMAAKVIPRGDPDREAAERGIRHIHALRAKGSIPEKVGFHAGQHAGKYAVGGAAGGGVLVGRKTREKKKPAAGIAKSFAGSFSDPEADERITKADDKPRKLPSAVASGGAGGAAGGARSPYGRKPVNPRRLKGYEGNTPDPFLDEVIRRKRAARLAGQLKALNRRLP